MDDDVDLQIRLTAVEHMKRVGAGGVLSSDELRAGFQFRGERMPLINPQRGIFKPAAMEKLLSVRTVFPRSGRKIWYDDQRLVHEQIERGDQTIDYAFMGDDSNSRTIDGCESLAIKRRQFFTSSAWRHSDIR